MFNPLEIFSITDIINIYILNNYLKLNSILITLLFIFIIISILNWYYNLISLSKLSNRLILIYNKNILIFNIINIL